MASFALGRRARASAAALSLATPLSRYAFAVAATGLAVLIRAGVTSAIGTRYPFAPFFFAILVSGWFGGLGPALFSTLLSVVAVATLWVEPIGSPRVSSPQELG